MSELNIKIDGVAAGFRLTPEQQEALKMLYANPDWKVYKSLLAQSRVGYFNSLLPMTDPNNLLKTTGIVAGINFAENQLGILVGEIERKEAKRVAEESKNQPQP